MLIDGRVTPQELEFQETMIAEREAEIREIETGIHELNDIFRDLGTIVEQQGGLVGISPDQHRLCTANVDVDNIESNIVSVAQNTSSAADELTTAHEYQRKAGRRMACLLVILIIVIAVVLLAVSWRGRIGQHGLTRRRSYLSPDVFKDILLRAAGQRCSR